VNVLSFISTEVSLAVTLHHKKSVLLWMCIH